MGQIIGLRIDLGIGDLERQLRARWAIQHILIIIIVVHCSSGVNGLPLVDHKRTKGVAAIKLEQKFTESITEDTMTLITNATSDAELNPRLSVDPFRIQVRRMECKQLCSMKEKEATSMSWIIKAPPHTKVFR